MDNEARQIRVTLGDFHRAQLDDAVQAYVTQAVIARRRRCACKNR